VEAGAVLGDICAGTDDYNYSDHFNKNLSAYCGFKIDNNQKPPSVYSKAKSSQTIKSGGFFISEENPPLIRDAIILLKKNYRFTGALSGISTAVNKGDSDSLFKLLRNSNENEIVWIDPEKDKNYKKRIEQHLIDLYSLYINEKDVEKAYTIFNSFRVLCALRKGPFGTETINNWIEKILKDNGLINPYRQFYNNKPVIITKNDYYSGLFNGDIGILRGDASGASGGLYIYFRDPEGSFKKYSPYKIRDHETVYSMTVHKSQGSEFENVILILPDVPNPVITRELIYTGITRTKSRIHIIAKRNILEQGISKTINRTSGIYRALWNA
jgi:exodeoxyribonuclease V alpha subunit